MHALARVIWCKRMMGFIRTADNHADHAAGSCRNSDQPLQGGCDRCDQYARSPKTVTDVWYSHRNGTRGGSSGIRSGEEPFSSWQNVTGLSIMNDYNLSANCCNCSRTRFRGSVGSRNLLLFGVFACFLETLVFVPAIAQQSAKTPRVAVLLAAFPVQSPEAQQFREGLRELAQGCGGLSARRPSTFHVAFNAYGIASETACVVGQNLSSNRAGRKVTSSLPALMAGR